MAPRSAVAIGSSTWKGWSQVTSRARSRPTIERDPRAWAISASRSSLRVEITPRLAPCVRRCRVSMRVSISLMPTMPFSSRYWCSSPDARQEEARTEASRTMNPATWGRTDSTSSRFTP